MMSELNTPHPEEIIKSNSVWYNAVKPGYSGDFPETLVLYVETAYDLQMNQLISRNLDEIQKIYAAHNLHFLYLPLLLQDCAHVFGYIYPGAELNQAINPENITSVITAKLFTELHVSTDVQGPMLLTHSYNKSDHAAGWMITRMRGKISAGQFFRTHASIYTYYDFKACAKYSKVLDSGFPYQDPDDPEERFDTEVNRIVSEIDERIRFLKEKGLFRLLSDTIAPMLKSEPSRLRVTEDFRLFLPDYNNMEIAMHPLSKVVYFLFLRHPEGIFIKHLFLYRYELTQIYRLLSNRENLEDMDESIRKLTDPSDNSIYEKCSRIKREFLRKMSDDLAQHYYIKGDEGKPKEISLSRTLTDLPDILKNIQIPREILMDMRLLYIGQFIKSSLDR